MSILAVFGKTVRPMMGALVPPPFPPPPLHDKNTTAARPPAVSSAVVFVRRVLGIMGFLWKEWGKDYINACFAI